MNVGIYSLQYFAFINDDAVNVYGYPFHFTHVKIFL